MLLPIPASYQESIKIPEESQVTEEYLRQYLNLCLNQPKYALGFTRIKGWVIKAQKVGATRQELFDACFRIAWQGLAHNKAMEVEQKMPLFKVADKMDFAYKLLK